MKRILILLLVFGVHSMDGLSIPDQCGLSISHNTGNRIVGGREALPGEFPWMVSLQLHDPFMFEYHHFCGGSILNKHWILTAAHCLTEKDTESIQVVFGTNHLLPHESGHNEGETRLSIEKIVIHNRFSTKSLLNDIALIKVKGEINFRASKGLSNSICLPEANHPLEPNSFVTAAGWGHTGMSGPPEESPLLMTVELPVWHQNQCIDKYGPDQIKETVFCAGSIGGQDTCHGDSGGPVIQSEGNRAVVVGIVSYGTEPKRCGRPFWPAVYTLVSKYVEWIHSHIWH